MRPRAVACAVAFIVSIGIITGCSSSETAEGPGPVAGSGGTGGAAASGGSSGSGGVTTAGGSGGIAGSGGIGASVGGASGSGGSGGSGGTTADATVTPSDASVADQTVDTARIDTGPVADATTEIPPPTVPTTAKVVQSSKAGDKLTAKPDLTFTDDDGSTLPTVTIDPTQMMQRYIGFGGAFTETAAYSIAQMPADKRSVILNALFNPVTGAGFTLSRTQIGACDFSVAEYNYDNTAGDTALANFSIDHEKQWMIPMMKEAMAVPGASIKIYASPWSPPGWMKSTNSMLHGTLKKENYPAFALYLSKYVQEMAKNGIEIWGITMQNEPEFDSPWYPSCGYTATTELDFLKNYFGPQLEKDGLKTKVMIHDHNTDHVATWANTILGDPVAAKYASGIAYHWYGTETFTNLDLVHNGFPNHFILETEAAEPFTTAWNTWTGIAEREAHSIMGACNHWANGWSEWNLVVDTNGGGPGYTGSQGQAPIMVDLKAADAGAPPSVYYNPHLYYIGQFAKYIRPDAVRIAASYTGTLEVTAARNVDGSTVVVVLNRGDAAAQIKIKQGAKIIKPTIEAHSIVDFIY
jgi:glucosylceramidase